LKKFTTCNNWREFYPNASEEELTHGPQPEPGIKKAQININFDADHGHDVLVVVTRKSVTGISKRQKTVEAFRVGSMLDPNWLQLLLLQWSLPWTSAIFCESWVWRATACTNSMIFRGNNLVIIDTSIQSSMLWERQDTIAPCYLQLIM
jgi:hypothetical protein